MGILAIKKRHQGPSGKNGSSRQDAAEIKADAGARRTNASREKLWQIKRQPTEIKTLKSPNKAAASKKPASLGVVIQKVY